LIAGKHRRHGALYTSATRSSAVAEKPRDAPYYLEIVVTRDKQQTSAKILSVYKRIHFLYTYHMYFCTFSTCTKLSVQLLRPWMTLNGHPWSQRLQEFRFSGYFYYTVIMCVYFTSSKSKMSGWLLKVIYPFLTVKTA